MENKIDMEKYFHEILSQRQNFIFLTREIFPECPIPIDESKRNRMFHSISKIIDGHPFLLKSDKDMHSEFSLSFFQYILKHDLKKTIRSLDKTDMQYLRRKIELLPDFLPTEEELKTNSRYSEIVKKLTSYDPRFASLCPKNDDKCYTKEYIVNRLLQVLDYLKECIDGALQLLHTPSDALLKALNYEIVRYYDENLELDIVDKTKASINTEFDITRTKKLLKYNNVIKAIAKENGTETDEALNKLLPREEFSFSKFVFTPYYLSLEKDIFPLLGLYTQMQLFGFDFNNMDRGVIKETEPKQSNFKETFTRVLGKHEDGRFLRFENNSGESTTFKSGECMALLYFAYALNNPGTDLAEATEWEKWVDELNIKGASKRTLQMYINDEKVNQKNYKGRAFGISNTLEDGKEIICRDYLQKVIDLFNKESEGIGKSLNWEIPEELIKNN